MSPTDAAKNKLNKIMGAQSNVSIPEETTTSVKSEVSIEKEVAQKVIGFLKHRVNDMESLNKILGISTNKGKLYEEEINALLNHMSE